MSNYGTRRPLDNPDRVPIRFQMEPFEEGGYIATLYRTNSGEPLCQLIASTAQLTSELAYTLVAALVGQPLSPFSKTWRKLLNGEQITDDPPNNPPPPKQKRHRRKAPKQVSPQGLTPL